VLVFVLFFITTSSLIGIIWWYDYRMQHIETLTGIITHVELNLKQTDKVEKDFFSAETINPRFYQTGQSSYIDKHAQLLRKITEELDTLRRSDFFLHLDGESHHIDSLQKTLTLYDSTFQLLVRKMHQRGFKESGLEGQMRKQIHLLENSLEMSPILPVLLMVRRNEKDFILRKEIHYAENVYRYVAQVRKYINENIKNETDRVKFFGALNQYEQFFVALTDIEREMGYDNSLGIRGKLEKISRKIEQESEAMNGQIHKKANQIRNQIKTVLLLVVFFGLGINFVLGYFIIQKLGEPLQRISASIHQIVAQDFNDNVQVAMVKSQDEIGELVKDLNYMVNNVRLRRKEILEKNAELEQQKEEILTQQELLEEHNAELEQQKEEILAQHELLEQKTRELQEKNAELEQQKEEILAQHELLEQHNREMQEKNAELERLTEEIGAQRDLLSEQFSLIENKNEELEKQKKVVQTKNRNITASIQYAKRIQEAMLPSLQSLQSLLPESFIFFKPRDIVSGDFYFFTKQKDKIFLAVADCTGHGVPGAFMSVIGINLLIQTIQWRHILEADKILEALHKGIVDFLKQHDTDNRDGMDIALCVIDPQNKDLCFAGAKRPLIYVQENKLHHIRGNKISIGGINRRAEHRYDTFHISYEKPTQFYIFSDGLEDQFGEAQNKKFSLRRLKEILYLHQHLEMSEQERTISQAFHHWLGKERQIDDVLMIGFLLR
jgi:serine phosphatase RsbU (regulator of sigma subunit)